MQTSMLLKHKDDNVALLELNQETGMIIRSHCYMPDLMPFFRDMNLKEMNTWWKLRAIPEERNDLKEKLEKSGCETAELYLSKNLGLSLSDAYWVCPINYELQWKDVNLYENIKRTTFERNDTPEKNGKYYVYTNDPNGSLNGSLDKEAIYEDGIWKLYKYNDTTDGQQSINEGFADLLHSLQGFKDYIKYSIMTEDNKAVGCICDFFTNIHLELIPAYNIANSEIQNNETSNYEHYINVCRNHGLDENIIRKFMDYQTLSDFIMSNSDRHYMNFGVLRDIDTLKIVSPAPIFDFGNSMFYKDSRILSAKEILDKKISGMADYEEKMLTFITDRKLLDINKLPSIDKVIEFYTKYGIDEHKAEVIGYNYRLKTEMMQQFQKGLKVSRYTVKDWYKFKNTQSKEVLSIKETKKEEIDATDDFGEH